VSAIQRVSVNRVGQYCMKHLCTPVVFARGEQRRNCNGSIAQPSSTILYSTVQGRRNGGCGRITLYCCLPCSSLLCSPPLVRQRYLALLPAECTTPVWAAGLVGEAQKRSQGGGEDGGKEEYEGGEGGEEGVRSWGRGGRCMGGCLEGTGGDATARCHEGQGARCLWQLYDYITEYRHRMTIRHCQYYYIFFQETTL